MSQLTFNDGDLLSVVQGVINGNAGDVENRVANTTIFRTTADVMGATTDEGDSGNARGLPAGHYHFDNNLDVGLLHFVLTSLDGFYKITSSSFQIVTYTGTADFIVNDVSATGTAFVIVDTIFSTPNSKTFNITDGNSLIFKLAVFAGCQSVGTYEGSFFTGRAVAITGCGTGLTCNNVATAQIDTLQWSTGQDIGGTALKMAGTGGVCIISGCDSRVSASEFYIDIDAGYTGSVSMTGGSHNTIGTFFKGARDQSDVEISISNIAHQKSSRADALGHYTGNSTETVISTIDTPVKLNAVWTAVEQARFTVDTNGRWTYTGLEDVCLSVAFVSTIDPVGGGSRDISVYIAKNGTFDPNSKGSATLSAGGQIGSTTIVDFVTGDFIEPFVENNSGTQNIIGVTSTFRIG